MKHIGQSPSTGFLFPDSFSVDALSLGLSGAFRNISRSSYTKRNGVKRGYEREDQIQKRNIRMTEERLDIGGDMEP